MEALPVIVALFLAVAVVAGLRSLVGGAAAKGADARIRRESKFHPRDLMLSPSSGRGAAIDHHRKEIAVAHAHSDRQVNGKTAGERLRWIDTHRDAVVVGILAFFGLTLFAMFNKSPNFQSIPVDAKPAGSGDIVRLSRKQKLENISMENLSWSKEGFGNVMVASFVISNHNPAPIKDVQVTCVHAADSGTMIDRNVRTIFERIESGSYFYVRDLNMGFIHTQAVRSTCYVSDFVG
jgi:hypothetical protein